MDSGGKVHRAGQIRHDEDIYVLLLVSVLDEGVAHPGGGIPVDFPCIVAMLISFVIPKIVAMPLEQTDMITHQGIPNLLPREQFDVVQILFDFTWYHDSIQTVPPL